MYVVRVIKMSESYELESFVQTQPAIWGIAVKCNYIKFLQLDSAFQDVCT